MIMNIWTQTANIINNWNQFKAFQVWYYDDLQDLVNKLQEQIDDEKFNQKNICVCIWNKTTENIEAQKQMIKNVNNI